MIEVMRITDLILSALTKNTHGGKTNAEKYTGVSHNHYVFERMCPKCNCTVCGREPSDFRECSIKDKRDYEQWLAKSQVGRWLSMKVGDKVQAGRDKSWNRKN